MYFVFIDETGDPGRKGSKYFGMAALRVNSKCYDSIRRLLFHYRLLSGMFPEVKDLPQKPIAHLNLLRGIHSLVEAGLMLISGLYIDKERYGGRYLHWVDSGTGVPATEWSYYLRNYLLRHLLEMHFFGTTSSTEDIDLVLDRVILTEDQRINTLSYLNSRPSTVLRQPFGIPQIKYLTIADSQYVGALQLVHIIADLLKNCASDKLTDDQKELLPAFNIAQYLGHKQL